MLDNKQKQNFYSEPQNLIFAHQFDTKIMGFY